MSEVNPISILAVFQAMIMNPAYAPPLFPAAGVSLAKGSALLKGRLKSKAAMVTCQRIDIRGIRNKSRDQVCMYVCMYVDWKSVRHSTAQCNLRTRDTMGPTILSLVERLSLLWRSNNTLKY